MSRRPRPPQLVVYPVCKVQGIELVVSKQLKRMGMRGVAYTNGFGQKVAAVSLHLPPTGPKFLEAIIHEVMHLQRPRATERQVRQQAHQLATILRRAGYRITPLEERRRRS